MGINGEHVTAAAALPLLRQLADARILAPDAVRSAGADVLDLLRGWYAAGWLHLTTEARPT